MRAWFRSLSRTTTVMSVGFTLFACAERSTFCRGDASMSIASGSTPGRSKAITNSSPLR